MDYYRYYTGDCKSFFLALYSRSFEWTSTHGLTALTNYTSYWNYFKVQTLENMLLLKAGKRVLCFFYFAKNSAHTATDAHFLQPLFYIQMLK